MLSLITLLIHIKEAYTSLYPGLLFVKKIMPGTQQTRTICAGLLQILM